MTKRFFTLLLPFCGIGLGGVGFLDSVVRMLGREARFRCIGGIDNDPAACADFEYLTKAPALCADIGALTVDQLVAFAGAVAPDCVFLSPPCKGFSGLLSKKAAGSKKYRRLNRLVLDWVRLMLEAWGDAPPKLVLLENVPRIASRGRRLLRAVKARLRRAGYLFSEQTHDCGELGGLAQHRDRFLLVARHGKQLQPLLYQPPKKRVRGVGEVLGPLPLPNDPAAGPMHRLPKLSWINWVRLALIPAGGDWRDLNGVLADGQPRREVFRRHHVAQWTKPAATVAGRGSNGVQNVADPRVEQLRFKQGPNAHHNKMRVEPWDAPSHTVTGAQRVGSGAPSVADPRAAELLEVRVAYDHGYGVLRWDEPSSTVAGGTHAGQGAYSVADLRVGQLYNGTYGVMGWRDAAGTITGNARIDTGRFAVADPRKPPPSPVIIIAEDGTWHRPLTILEKGVLQGLPTEVDGKPVQLAGTSTSAWSERIGNAVPRQAGEAMGTQFLVCLLAGEAGGFALSSGGAVWVDPQREAALQ